MFPKCLLLCLLCVFNKIESKLDKLIRGGYVYINETNNFYHLRNDATPFSWLHAKAACELEDGTLFFPENEHETETVIAHFQDTWTTEKIYVGIVKPTAIRNQIDAAESFKTMDGRALEDVYSNSWGQDQPDNNEGNEHCVCMFKNALLHDYPCLKPFDDVHFICKKTEVASLKKDCKPGKFFINDYTYLNETRSFYKFHNKDGVLSWLHAKAACELEGATLFFPETKYEAEVVIAHFRNSWTAEKIYVGIVKPTAIRNQIDAAEGFKTMDGRALEAVYNNWSQGQPDNRRGAEHCVCMFKDGLLHDYPCLKAYNDVQFICKQTVTQNAKPNKFFRKGYKYLKATESFYKIHTIPRNWNDARTTCELEGATLFYPQDEEEAYAVISYWNSTQLSFWIHIGVSAHNVINVYETIDGLPVEEVYNEWAPAEPSGGSESCVILRRDGLITDDECDLSWPFICKKTEASLRWNDLCGLPDPVYTYHNATDRCYKLHLTPKSWKDAYTTCSVEGSRVAVINSDEEAKIFVDMIKSSSNDLIGDAAHLGFKYDNGWKIYQGTHLSSSGYVKWDDGQPDRSGNKTCGSMLYNGLLSAVNCNDKRIFICEKSIVSSSK
ncbi:C-type mannose receptor 2-like isoform X2 [Aricia agestis]|uniref:C-type mannose receptor 2-like isoform X2 n=1 Tax=Aricia agestis TaxID=91739 RepID=UPI001C205C63|nr:C-type mannose receptor 2-like isoform X2 [Aricia agestis]